MILSKKLNITAIGTFTAIFAVVMGACSKDEAPELRPVPDGQVIFTAQLQRATRSTETAFEEGDMIGVFAVIPQENQPLTIADSGNFADNVPYTFDGSRFTSQAGIIKEEDDALSYTAVYPYMEGIGADFDFSVKPDQSAHADYASSDLCTVTTASQTDSEVNLKFYHRLSHIVLNINGFNIAGDMSLKMTNVSLTSHADLNANTFTATGEAASSIVPNEDATNSYRLILPPQKIAAGTEMVVVNLNGREFIIKTPSDLDFASGREYVFNLSLVNGSIVLAEGEILPWDNETIEHEFTENFFSIQDATFHAEEMQAGTDDSDPFDISANESALAGGMNFITISCDNFYEAFELSVKGETGYWEVIPEITQTRASYSYTIPIIYGPSFSEDMEMIVCGRQPDGKKTIGYDVTFNYVQSKWGDLNINLTFSTPKDVDLHLYTPSGQHIYYGNRGGDVVIDGQTYNYGLDHDSNAGCSIDNLNNENIFIPAALVENGTYIVKVDMYKNCNTSYDCAWSVVARYQNEIIANEISQFGNPASGVYAANCGKGDYTTVMQFTINKPETQLQKARNANLVITPRPVTEAELDKIEDELYFSSHGE